MILDITIVLTVIFGVFGVAESISTVIALRNDRNRQKIETENLLFSLQADLTTGETWEMLNKKPVDSKYLILLYERVVTRFETLKKVADQNSPAIQSIIRNVSYIDDLIAGEYKDKNANDQWARTYSVAKQMFIDKLEKINIVSDFYGDDYVKKASVQEVVGQRLIDTLDFTNVKTILDFGCGNGRDSFKMHDLCNAEIDGFDASETLIRKANERKNELGIRNMRFSVRDANAFKDTNKYDIVFCNFVIHWIGPQCFTIIYDTLRAGGQFVASISGEIEGGFEFYPIIWEQIEKLGYSKYFDEWNDTRYMPSKEMVEKELEKLGFSSINVTVDKHNRLDIESDKPPSEVYDAELETTLPPYFAMLKTNVERTKLRNTALELILEHKPPISSVDLFVRAVK